MTATPLQEERANTLTHAFGLLLGIVAVPALLVNQYGAVPAREWLSMLVFGFTLLQVYATSTIYHAVTGARWKYRLRVLDHISIYFLIAGTHTPLLVHYLPGESGRFYLIVIWEWLSVAFYLVMGWMGALTIPEMAQEMSAPTFYGVILGGVSYTLGVVFYAWHRLPYHHAIWHVFWAIAAM